jgi:hypothetical protein
MWMWLAGGLAWGIHLHRKFMSCVRVCDAELAICQRLNLTSAEARSEHWIHLERAEPREKSNGTCQP